MGAGDKPTATMPDNVFDIERGRRIRIEALLDLRLQPGVLFGPMPLMRDGCDDCRFAAAIGALASFGALPCLNRAESWDEGTASRVSPPWPKARGVGDAPPYGGTWQPVQLMESFLESRVSKIS